MTLGGEYIEQVVVQVAMHADETLFGHGLSEDDYEDKCEEFADMLHGEVYEALRSRDPR